MRAAPWWVKLWAAALVLVVIVGLVVAGQGEAAAVAGVVAVLLASMTRQPEQRSQAVPPALKPTEAAAKARQAWQRGDAIHVYTALSGTLFFNEAHQRQTQDDLNAISAVGWRLQDTSAKIGHRVFTFVRPD